MLLKNMIDDHYIVCFWKLSLFTPNGKIEVRCANQITNASSNLDILKQTPSTNELVTKLVTKELLIFKCDQMDLIEIKCSLQWWGKQENMFLTIGFVTCQILGIVGSQIEAKKILKSNDSRIDCKPPFNLVEMIEDDLNFEEFEGSFEQDEFVDI